MRVAGSLLVLRWAFVGGIVALLADLSDLFLMDSLHLGGVRDYQSFDKWLDQVYMAAFLAVALRWKGAPRAVAVALYAYRMVGFVAFEAFDDRGLLVFFPNVFELWFLFVASLRHWRPDFAFSRRGIALALTALLALKEAQELIIHQFRLLDTFTSLEAVEAIFDWISAPFR